MHISFSLNEQQKEKEKKEGNFLNTLFDTALNNSNTVYKAGTLKKLFIIFLVEFKLRLMSVSKALAEECVSYFFVSCRGMKCHI